MTYDWTTEDQLRLAGELTKAINECNRGSDGFRACLAIRQAIEALRPNCEASNHGAEHDACVCRS